MLITKATIYNVYCGFCYLFIDKPNSVSDNYLSRCIVTNTLKRYFLPEGRTRPCIEVRILPFHLGVATKLLLERVRWLSPQTSLLAPLKSPWTGVTRYPSALTEPMFGLSSLKYQSNCLIKRRFHGITTIDKDIYMTQLPNLCIVICMIHTKHIAIIVAVFALGVGTGIFFKPDHESYNTYKKVLFSNDTYTKNSPYKLINPLLSCGDINNITSKQTDAIESTVTKIIQQEESTGTITSTSVYFRDLNNGPWVGINQDETFIPGSLLKVPLLIGVFKLIENDPSILNQSIVYEGSDIKPAPQEFKPSVDLEIGKKYTVAQLLQIMIVYSNNNAALLLSKMFDGKTLTSVYSDLGLSIPETGNDYQITTKDYASFFRILYNATYLSQPASESALGLLSQTEFTKGIVAGVPDTITVTHKFGERVDGDIKQLHDCGIVYYTKQPYALCVMTRGKDMQKLTGVIERISRSVYTIVNNN